VTFNVTGDGDRVDLSMAQRQQPLWRDRGELHGQFVAAGTPVRMTWVVSGTCSLRRRPVRGVGGEHAPSITTHRWALQLRGSERDVFSGSQCSPAPTVQWQKSTDAGATFANMPGGGGGRWRLQRAANENGNRIGLASATPARTCCDSAAGVGGERLQAVLSIQLLLTASD